MGQAGAFVCTVVDMAKLVLRLLGDVALTTLVVVLTRLLGVVGWLAYPVATPGLYQRLMRAFAHVRLWAWPEHADEILDHAVVCLVGAGADARVTQAWADRLRP